MAPPPARLQGVTLACLNCADQRVFELSPGQLQELFQQQQLKLFCPNCQTATAWSAVELDRRSNKPRREIRRVQVELPIRVSANLPGLRFTEVTRTVNASRGGACFLTRQPLREGMEVSVLMPYEEGESLPETRAQVVRVEEHGSEREISLKFIR